MGSKQTDEWYRQRAHEKTEIEALRRTIAEIVGADDEA